MRKNEEHKNPRGARLHGNQYGRVSSQSNGPPRMTIPIRRFWPAIPTSGDVLPPISANSLLFREFQVQHPSKINGQSSNQIATSIATIKLPYFSSSNIVDLYPPHIMSQCNLVFKSSHNKNPSVGHHALGNFTSPNKQTRCCCSTINIRISRPSIIIDGPHAIAKRMQGAKSGAVARCDIRGCRGELSPCSCWRNLLLNKKTGLIGSIIGPRQIYLNCRYGCSP